jgi:hypothetical protein
MDPDVAWSFAEMETNLIALPNGSRPPFEDQRQIVTPLRFENGGFGAGIYLNTEASGAPDPDLIAVRSLVYSSYPVPRLRT